MNVMPIPFSSALYYPSIDIRNTNWLKTSVLFWDSIYTIVPKSMREPYRNDDTKRLADAGFLRPLRVNPTDHAVTAIENDAIDLLRSPELVSALQCIGANNADGSHMSRALRDELRILGDERELHIDKISYKLRDEIENILSRGNGFTPNRERIYDTIHKGINDILDEEEIIQEIRDRFRYTNQRLGEGDVYLLDAAFTYAYMTALAERLSEDRSLSMVTDDAVSFSAGNALRWGNQTQAPRPHRGRRQLEQGLLLDFVIEGISLSPDTKMKDIIAFKNKRRDELGRFKAELAQLTQNIDTSRPIDAIRDDIRNIYENSLVPSVNALKEALHDAKIDFFAGTFLKVALTAASIENIPMAIPGLPTEWAVYAGVGLSIVASSVSYGAKKREALRGNPYTYLLSIQNKGF